MYIIAPQAHDLTSIQSLLHKSHLPYLDLTGQNLAHFLVARDGKEIAAVGGLELFGRSGLLRSLAVRKQYRSKGLGRHLVALLEENAWQQGVQTLYLLTTSAERFFTHLGYQRQTRQDVPAEIQASREFSELCPEHAICMFRHLS